MPVILVARVYGALVDPDTSATAGTAALLDLSREIRELGVPVVVTDMQGRPTCVANIPDVGDGIANPNDRRRRKGVRRIVEESHHGRLVLVPSDRGAVFDVILHG